MLRVVSDNPMIWATDADGAEGVNPSATEANHAGWYFDLPITKERVIRNFMIRDGKAIVITSVPKDSPCEAGGDSMLMEMDACSGGRLGGAQFDIADDATIDTNDLITIPDPNDPTKEILVAPTGIHYPVMMYPPKILRMPDDTETKYFSTAAGNIEMLRETGEKRGIYYWRCVE
jgi:Tfp pilus tip-associated adhesin PilY1